MYIYIYIYINVYIYIYIYMYKIMLIKLLLSYLLTKIILYGSNLIKGSLPFYLYAFPNLFEFWSGGRQKNHIDLKF